jgi:hypothetical protein
MAINSALCSPASARTRLSSDGFFLREDRLRFVERRLLFDLALLEDLAARLRRWDVARDLLFVTGEPPVGRL